MKTLFKNTIGLLLGNNFAFRILRTVGKRRLTILYYHRVIRKIEPKFIKLSGMYVDVDAFNQQMNFLKEFYNVISEQDIIEAVEKGKELPDYAVWITFDDGYKDNYTNAFPILKKYDIPATIFVTTGYINKQTISCKTNDSFMTWDEIKELSNANIVIGAHTVSHRILSNLPDEEMTKEILQSKDEIGQKIGKDVASFAYPIGKRQHYCLEKCAPILKKNNFWLAVNTIGGFNTIEPKKTPFNLRRMGLSYEDRLNFFKFKISLGSFWQR